MFQISLFVLIYIIHADREKKANGTNSYHKTDIPLFPFHFLLAAFLTDKKKQPVIF